MESRIMNNFKVRDLMEIVSTTPVKLANTFNEKFGMNIDTVGLSNHVCGVNYKDFVTTYSIMKCLLSDVNGTLKNNVDMNKIIEKCYKKYENISVYLVAKLNTAESIMYSYSQGEKLGLIFGNELTLDSSNKEIIVSILKVTVDICEEHIDAAFKTYEDFIEKLVELNTPTFMDKYRNMTTAELVDYANNVLAMNIPKELVGVNKYKDLYIIKEILHSMFVCSVRYDVIKRIEKAGTVVYSNDEKSEERYLENIDVHSISDLVDEVDDMFYEVRNRIRNNKHK